MTLPGLSHTLTERADALALAQGAAYTVRLRSPRPSIDCTVRDMHLHAPLFRKSPANPQQGLFDAAPAPAPPLPAFTCDGCGIRIDNIGHVLLPDGKFCHPCAWALYP